MGREIKRVPPDFDWPPRKVWHGYLMPETLCEEQCPACEGTGSSDHARSLHDLWYGYLPFDPTTTGSTPLTPATPEVRHFAERNVSHAPDYYGTGEAAIVREATRLADLWNGMWSHHLDQADVDALVEAERLMDLTHTWRKGDGWKPIEPAPTVTAGQVNLWSLRGFGHDAINCWVVIAARCERDGVTDTCSVCGGHGSTEAYPGQRAEADAWKKSEPPSGDGWQLWETVSEGSPVSPVFGTSEGLVAWMSDPARGREWVTPEAAAKFIAEGWAPTLIASDETGVVSGVEWVGTRDEPT